VSKIVNIYCDESSHLPNDSQPVMVLGAIACPLEQTGRVGRTLRGIRENHHLPSAFEIKWTKVSPAKLDYYEELVDYFFSEDGLRFRAVVASKAGLNHSNFGQTHDDWYYKMMYLLLSRVQVSGRSQRIYLDKKDSHSGTKVRKLHDILLHNHSVSRLQIVQSHDVIHMQLADLLLGAVGYANRGVHTSPAKVQIMDRIVERSGHPLTASTSPSEKKFNLFHWTGQS